jgi:hypothetical protein
MASDPASRILAAERQRQVVLLRIRGIDFTTIGKQIGITKQSTRSLYQKALNLIPKADLEEMRKLEGERIADLRQRVWSELAGRPGKDGQTVKPEPDLVVDLIDKALKISRHEAMVFGLDAPTKAQVLSAAVGQSVSDQELDVQLARLTPEEQDTFMMLLQKLQGRWVQPPAIEEGSIETTAAPVTQSSN